MQFWVAHPNLASMLGGAIPMGNALQDKTVVVVGRGSGIARAVALLAHDEGARVIVAGRDKNKLADAYDGIDISVETVDVTDDSSISALADRLGRVDHVVSTRRPAHGESSPISNARTFSCRSTPRSSGRRCSRNTSHHR